MRQVDWETLATALLIIVVVVIVILALTFGGRGVLWLLGW